MQTECPHCHTVFHVKADELTQADCQVRCGHCLAIFTAENPLELISYPDVNDITGTNLTDETTQNDAVNNALASNSVKPDTTAASPSGGPQLNFAMGSELGLDLSSDEPDSDSLGQENLSEQTTTHHVADVIPPELRAEERQTEIQPDAVKTALLAILILCGIAAGILQYAYYNRNALVKIPELQSLFQAGCGLIGCTPPEPRDVALITLNSKNIFDHPNVENALMMSASIINQARFAQDFPVIELRFNNIRGEVIAARRFHPTEYLGIPEKQISVMQPGIPISINLEIKDPGSNMVSYDFDFL
ncbi:MAG TPA: DUF3426 domain-containing protein [Gammaproteobacteria bacterium]|nr:DUF3426 domain-containing protein [Gammaproteobacteria bacterium]